jgi:hypothetical protein
LPPPGPVPTLGELQASASKWVWAYCEGLDPAGAGQPLHRNRLFGKRAGRSLNNAEG